MAHTAGRLRTDTAQSGLQPGVRDGARMNLLFELPVELQETGDGYLVRVDAPGVGRENLTLDLRGDTLIIAGERRACAGGARTHFSERTYGKFSRAITLPTAIRRDAVRASYHDGVLEVVLPKALPCGDAPT